MGQYYVNTYDLDNILLEMMSNFGIDIVE